MLVRGFGAGALALIAGLLVAAEPSASPPVADKRPVENVYHGTKVVDPYQWLEDWNDAEVRAWSEKQNKYARAVLDGLPAVRAIRHRVEQILSARFVSYDKLRWCGGKLFALKFQPPQPQPTLVVLDSLEHTDSARVLVDPKKLAADGSISIDWYVPSPDGKLVAVSLSKGGSETGDVHVFQTATAEQLSDVVAKVNGGTAGGDLAWAPDGAGFFYTRYPRPGERPAEDLGFFQQLYYHRLGSAESDRYEIGNDFPRIAEIKLETDETGKRLLASVQDGDSGRFSHHLRSSDGHWTQITDYPDQVVQATFGPDNSLYLISLKDAPRGRILRLQLGDPHLQKAEVFIDESDDAIVHDFYGSPTWLSTPGYLYLEYQQGGPSELRVFDHQGNRKQGPRRPPVSSVGGLTHLAGDEVLFSNTSYVEPTAWLRFDPKAGRSVKTALSTRSPVDFSDTEVVREFATSKDGTRIPVNVVRRKGLKLDGSHPMVVAGYGGYGVSLSPFFCGPCRIFIEQGVVFAQANLRGGGEFGKKWHDEGRLTEKQNVFDDFAAVLQHVVKNGYTTPQKLGIIGVSNGGLLMGAMLTQHPDLFKATVSYVGIYDMLRSELSPNGAFNVPEFGTVKDAEQFRALYAYSPYHHVRDAQAYPAVLFMTGANDPRVDPMHSRKMTARLQAAAAGKTPILLRTSDDSGHGFGTPLREKIEELADQDAFLFDQLGVKYH
jgi:prolyl oligopeptidase